MLLGISLLAAHRMVETSLLQVLQAMRLSPVECTRSMSCVCCGKEKATGQPGTAQAFALKTVTSDVTRQGLERQNNSDRQAM